MQKDDPSVPSCPYCRSPKFIRGYYCNLCGHGFITEELLRVADVQDFAEERATTA